MLLVEGIRRFYKKESRQPSKIDLELFISANFGTQSVRLKLHDDDDDETKKHLPLKFEESPLHIAPLRNSRKMNVNVVVTQQPTKKLKQQSDDYLMTNTTTASSKLSSTTTTTTTTTVTKSTTTPTVDDESVPGLVDQHSESSTNHRYHHIGNLPIKSITTMRTLTKRSSKSWMEIRKHLLRNFDRIDRELRAEFDVLVEETKTQ
jgi:hypothetical protein